MRYLIIHDRKYDLIEDYKNGFDMEEVTSKLTEYFYHFDYIVGDWSYGKLRLKGFCKKENPNYRAINDFENKEKYIQNNCAYDCRFFVLENLDVIKDSIDNEKL